MALGSNHLTQTVATGNSQFVPEIWSKEVQEAFKNNLVMANLTMRLDSMVKSFGDVIRIPKIPNRAAAGDKSAETEITPTLTTTTAFALTINKHKYSADMIEDFAKVQSIVDLRKVYVNAQAYSLAQVVDDDIMAERTNLTTTPVANGTGVTAAKLQEAVRKLDAGNVPLENRYLILDAFGREDIHGIADFTRYDALGEAAANNPIRRGFKGSIYGVDVYFSNNVKLNAATTTIREGVMFHEEAFALAMQLGPRVQAEYMTNWLSTLLVSDIIYGVATYRTDAGVIIRYT